MPRLTPAKGMVMSVEVSGGKAIVEIKNPKATLTIELAEDSGWVKALPEGAIVTYTLDVELPRETSEVATGPQPGDEIATYGGIVVVPEPTPVPAKAEPPVIDFEAIRLANPIPGLRTVGINAGLGAGESVRGLLGLPDYEPDDGTLKVASASGSANPAEYASVPVPVSPQVHRGT